jgi:hypothetical protein
VLGYSCNDDNNDEAYAVYPVSVQLLYPEGGEFSAVEGVRVQLLNNVTGAVHDTVTSADGKADFLVPVGVYEASVTDKRSTGGVANIFNGLRSGIIVTKEWTEASPAVTLALVLSTSSQVLIKELYVGGCQREGGTFQMDKYVILYNNSDNAASLDKLAFGMVLPYNATGSNNDYGTDGKLRYESQGWIPAGTGVWYFTSSVTLEPGEQVVISINGAINNTLTYPNSVDLSKAEYYCMYDIESYPNVTYYPSPAETIPTSHYLKAHHYGLGNAWPLSTSSPAFYLFTPKGQTLEAFIADAGNVDTEYSTTLVRKKLPVEWVVDGIEVFRKGAADNQKRLTAAVDAGYVNLTNAQGYTLYRNVDVDATTAIEGNAARLVYNYPHGTVDVEGTTDPSGIDAEASLRNGARIIYQDTNNSSSDFHQRKQSSLKDN